MVVSEGSDSETRGGSKNVMSWIRGIGSHGPPEVQAADGSTASAKVGRLNDDLLHAALIC